MFKFVQYPFIEYSMWFYYYLVLWSINGNNLNTEIRIEKDGKIFKKGLVLNKNKNLFVGIRMEETGR